MEAAIDLLRNKTILVTGSSRGLGLEICRLASSNGYYVIGVARPSEDLDALALALSTSPGGGRVEACDLSDSAELDKLLFGLRDDVQCIVHNLGGTLGLQDALFSGRDFIRSISTNFIPALEINRALIPRMILSESGTVIHISSMASIVNQGSASYSVAKAMLSSYAANLGNKLSASGIKVFNLVPSKIVSEAVKSGFQTDVYTYEEVARLVMLMLSGALDLMSGSSFHLDRTEVGLVALSNPEH